MRCITFSMYNSTKRILFQPLYAKERMKIAHHLPGTVCEPLVFSSWGGHTPGALNRLPRGGAIKGVPGVASRVTQNGVQQISLALLSSVIDRFSAFQDGGSYQRVSLALNPALQAASDDLERWRARRAAVPIHPLGEAVPHVDSVRAEAGVQGSDM